MELQDGGRTDIEVRADSLPTWEEKNERVIALGGQVLIKQGAVYVRASRAIVWVEITDPKQNAETRGTIYAEGEVRLDVGGKIQTAPAAILAFSTRGKLGVYGKIENKSIAESEFYRRAMRVHRPDAAQTPSVPATVKGIDATAPLIVQIQATTPPTIAPMRPTLNPEPREAQPTVPPH